MSTENPIYLTIPEAEELQALVEQNSEGADGDTVERLASELDRAVVVEPERLPPDVVTLGARVTFGDERSGVVREVTLVRPRDADAAHGRVSVLAPVGAALIGLRTGEAIEWPLPGGRTARFRIRAVVQPAPAFEPVSAA